MKLITYCISERSKDHHHQQLNIFNCVYLIGAYLVYLVTKGGWEQMDHPFIKTFTLLMYFFLLILLFEINNSSFYNHYFVT